MICERVGVALMLSNGGMEGGQGFGVEAEDEGLGCGRGLDFVEEHLEERIWDLVEAKRRFAHFADTTAEGGDMFGAEEGVMTEEVLEFVDRFGGEARGEDEVKPFEGVVEPFETRDAGFDAKTWAHGIVERAQAGERGEIFETGGGHESARGSRVRTHGS